MKLFLSALTKYLLGFVLVGAMLFLSAWTLDYPGAWLFLGLLFVPMLLMGAVMLLKAPTLLRERLDGKEKEKAQKGVVALAGLMFPIGFVLSAFDFRYGWSRVPLWLVIAASAFFLVGYAAYAEVMRENTYLSRTVKVQEGQKVISTGLYGVVRHPMYLATLLMFLPMPLILGSLLSFAVFLLYPFLIAKRILGEEELLKQELAGYADYCQTVRWRLVPYIW